MNGVEKVVLASSVNALGASFGDHLPVSYFPIDEEHPTRAQDAYARECQRGCVECWLSHCCLPSTLLEVRGAETAAAVPCPQSRSGWGSRWPTPLPADVRRSKSHPSASTCWLAPTTPAVSRAG